MKLPRAIISDGVAPLLFFAALYIVYFSPVLLSGRVLAPGDGLLQNYPAFMGSHSLWNPDLFSGYPAYADLQVAQWYPVRLLFAPFGSFNGFVLTAYVLASFFAFLLVSRLTSSRFAGICAGLVFGMGGFFVSHVGHSNMIHAAAWLPLHILALHELSLRPSSGWFAVAVGAVTCGVLAGHPQALVYSLLLAGAFTVFTSATSPAGAVRFLALAASSTAAGLGLAAIALIPMAELSSRGVRASLPFEWFVSFSIPLVQLPAILFPALFGGMPPSIYRLPYLGEWALAEITPWVGITPLLLAALSTLLPGRKKCILFWAAVALVSLVLAMGSATPLPLYLYHVPVLNKFRAQGRHVLELAMAIAILAGYGISSLEKLDPRRRLRAVGFGAAGCLAVMIAVLATLSAKGTLARMAEAVAGVGVVSLSPFQNPAVGLPFVLFGVTFIPMAFWALRPGRLTAALFVIALAVELGQFGWFFEWRFASPSFAETVRPAAMDRWANELSISHQRLFPIAGAGQPEGPVPNLSSWWELPSASGYNPLLLDSYRRFLGVKHWGSLLPDRLSGNDRSMDLLAVRWVFAPQNARSAFLASGTDIESLGTSESMKWSSDGLGIVLGPGCNPRNPVRVRLETEGIVADQIGLVSSLGCSAAVPDGTDVMKIVAILAGGSTTTLSVRAGEETSEWAWERSDVRGRVRHRMARPYSTSRERDDSGATFDAHAYLSLLSLGNAAAKVSAVDLVWTGPSASISIDKLSFRNSLTGEVFGARRPAAAGSAGRWKSAGSLGSSEIWENLRAMPRAWLVGETAVANDEEALSTVLTSRFPDGRPFDPARTALLESGLGLPVGPADPSSVATIVALGRDGAEVETRSATPALLLMSDVWYPGWTASIDGRPAPLLRADYLIRAVLVQDGKHRVRFAFRPRPLQLGAATSIGTFLVLALVFTASRRRREAILGLLPRTRSRSNA